MQAAEPGSRGWRDTDIAATGRSEGGPAVLRDWRGMGTQAVILHRMARLWTASTIAPHDCGPKKPESSQQIPQPCPQKLRPVALAEVFMKLAETCVVEQHIGWLFEAVEPTNLGPGTQDAAALIVRIVRGWAADIAAAPKGEMDGPGMLARSWLQYVRHNGSHVTLCFG